MPYLRKVTISGNDYYYLFHTVRDGSKYRKLSKYIGKEKPSDEAVENLKASFLAQIKDNNTSSEQEALKVNVINVLQDLQEQKGYLPKEDMIQLAHELEIPGVYMYGVATFYSQFKMTPPGKHILSMCTGTACHVKGSAELIEYISTMLAVGPGETTKDGKITFVCVNCIGACAKAPAMMINDTVYGDLTKDKIKQIISGLT